MTDKAREEMSALMDGEATELELHRVLKCSETDDELKASWRRYHVMRSIIRGEARDKTMLSNASTSDSMDIAAAVSQAIADEPSYKEESTVSKKSNPWVDKLLRPFGSVAVAASVSAMVIFGWQSTGGFNPNQASPTAPLGASVVASATNIAPSAATEIPAATRTFKPSYAAAREPAFNSRSSGYIFADDSGQAASRSGMVPSQDVIRLQVPRDERFNRYILSHSGNAAFNTVSGAIPYARVVTLKPTTRSAK